VVTPWTHLTRHQVEYRPFPLLTTLGSDDVAIERIAHLQKKFGKERAAMMLAHVTKRGKEVGIDLFVLFRPFLLASRSLPPTKFGGLVRQSTRAHRLLFLAYKKGGMDLQQALLAHLFRAYMELEEDIGSPPVLASYAHLVGLMGKTEAEEWLRGNEYEDEVTKLAAVSQGCGIQGVPFVVVDGKWAISGAQADQVYYQVWVILQHRGIDSLIECLGLREACKGRAEVISRTSDRC
jgi:predicted DsbA family dithiol-disulfide isomerase